jgi:intracellular multiplication protein IcmD
MENGMFKNKKIITSLIGLALLMVAGIAMADSIGGVAGRVKDSLGNVASMLGAASYVIGTGMFMVAIFQLKQHKENPTQTPLSKPMLFFVVAASLLYLPTLMGVTSGTLFATATTAGTAGNLPA